MKTVRLLLTLAATSLASLCSAQVITNTSSHSGYIGSAINFGSGGSLFQTFSNVSAVTSMTFNFFTTSTTTGDTFSATFGEWNGSSLVGGTTVNFANFTVPASGTWSNQSVGSFTGPTFEQVLDLTALTGTSIHSTYGYLTDSSKTYALVLTNLGTGTTVGLGLNTTNPFSFGGSNFGTSDWVFSQMAVYEGNQQLVPVPEPSTYAAAAGAVFVTGLVFARTRQRRRLAPTAPIAAA